MASNGKHWVVIPTLARAGMMRNPGTVTALLAAKQKFTLIVQPHEHDAYERAVEDMRPYASILTLPPKITTIAPTRQYILDMAPQNGKVLMLDDDLGFGTYRGDKTFTKSTLPEIVEAIRGVFDLLDHYTHASIGSRQGANYAVDDCVVHDKTSLLVHENARMQRALGYNVAKVRQAKCAFTKNGIEPLSDFDMTLQLLRAGHGNAILYDWVQDEITGGFQAPGGCSTWRTPTKLRAAQQRLASLHAPYVVLIDKTYKDRPHRTELRVAWKKAYQSSQRTAR